MSGVLVWGGLGLLFGAAVQGCGWNQAEGVYGTASLRQGGMARAMLYLLGIGMMMTALLCYLAVIDVDWVEVLPLHSGVILGGILFGLAAGLAGIVPGTALGGIGSGRLLESLSGTAGCVLGAWLARILPLEGVRGLFPAVEGTLFRVKLEGPWLLDGGFLALACVGVLLCVVALLIPMRSVPVPEQEAASEEPPGQAFVAQMPEESPLVVDTPAAEIDDLLSLEPWELTAVEDEETECSKEELAMPDIHNDFKTKPPMVNHPDIDPMPEEASIMARMEEVQEEAGILSPTEEVDIPVGARALKQLGEAAAEEEPEEPEEPEETEAPEEPEMPKKLKKR